jgi:two-component system cell cycle sensor histidine kinase/response regulator CckA
VNGFQNAHQKVISLNAVVRHVEASLSRAVEPEIRLERKLYEALDPVAADPAAIERLLLAFGRSAREALPQGGTLTIETDTVFLDKELVSGWPGMGPGAYSMLLVRDTRSVRRDSVSATPSAVADLDEAGAIAEQAGGRVEIEMVPGTGRVCRAYFPAVDAAAGAAAMTSTETILVVDDTDSLRDMMDRVLKSFGYQVLLARDGAQGLHVSEGYHGQIDLLISDVVMPGIGGPELAVRLRMRRPTLRVLLMSGYDEHSLASSAGSYASFIAKPFRPETLAKRIREVLDAAEGVRPA